MDGIVLFGFVLAKKVTKPLLIQHELTHYRQQKERGYLRFYWDYLFPSRRVAIEAEAYAVQVRGGEESLEWCAKTLSGPLYLWPCSIEAATAAIRGFCG
jgi:hypothetical protein